MPARSRSAVPTRPRRLAFVLCAAATLPAIIITQPPGLASQARSTDRTETRMHTYVGTTHAHTGAFNTHGDDDSTVEEVFDAARASGFDFLVLTEHSGPAGPKNPLAYYAEARRIAAEKTTGRFAAIAGYEYSERWDDGDPDRGHLTVMGTDDFVDATAPGMDFTAFLASLVDQGASRVVVGGFNHPGSAGHGASRSSLLTPGTRRIFSLTETYNHARYHQAREEQFYSAMIAELDRGWRVAPTCGIDSHGVAELVAVETAKVKPCRTGILAPSLSPARIVRALRARRVFATRDMNLRVRYRANDRWMGAQLGSPRRVQFTIRASDPDLAQPLDRISRIDIVGTGGAVLASHDVHDHRAVWRPRVRTGGNTYMLVRVFTDDQPTATAIAAPVWLGRR